jgi:hypothetical protein
MEIFRHSASTYEHLSMVAKAMGDVVPDLPPLPALRMLTLHVSSLYILPVAQGYLAAVRKVAPDLECIRLKIGTERRLYANRAHLSQDPNDRDEYDRMKLFLEEAAQLEKKKTFVIRVLPKSSADGIKFDSIGFETVVIGTERTGPAKIPKSFIRAFSGIGKTAVLEVLQRDKHRWWHARDEEEWSRDEAVVKSILDDPEMGLHRACLIEYRLDDQLAPDCNKWRKTGIKVFFEKEEQAGTPV